MVQSKALTTFFFAATVILPSLAVPLDVQGSEDLLTRDYDDGLVERDAATAVDPLFSRSNGVDLEAREPGFGGFVKGIFGKLFGRELEDTDDLLSRDYIFEEELD